MPAPGASQLCQTPPVPQAELVLGVQRTAQAGLVFPGDPPSSLGEEERGTKSNKKSLHGNVPVPRDTRARGCSNWGTHPVPLLSQLPNAFSWQPPWPRRSWGAR